MGTAGSVAFLAADAVFDPGTDEAGQTILVAFWNVTGGVAGAAVIGLFFTGVVGNPIVTHVQVFVVEVVLDRGVLIAGNDKAIVVDEARLLAIATDDVEDVIPSVPFWWVLHL